LPEELCIALVAHEARTGELADRALDRREQLANCTLTATGKTGLQALGPWRELALEPVLSRPFGGDPPIGTRVAGGRVDALVFFIDSLSAMSHDVGAKALRLRRAEKHVVCVERTTADSLVLRSQLIAEAKP
jgi:methylglyoxal synthase